MVLCALPVQHVDCRVVFTFRINTQLKLAWVGSTSELLSEAGHLQQADVPELNRSVTRGTKRVALTEGLESAVKC